MFIGLLYLRYFRSYYASVQVIVIIIVLFFSVFGMIILPSNVLIIIVTLIGCANRGGVKNVIH